MFGSGCIDVRAAQKFGRSFRLRRTISGNKIQGKVAGSEVVLSR
jgi:hypothetical protein